MKKNNFLTFLFACIPGAGQMYYGYMRRGLSMILIFCLTCMVATLLRRCSCFRRWCGCIPSLTPTT